MPCWMIDMVLMTGAAVLGYLIAWFWQPVDPSTNSVAAPNPKGKEGANPNSAKELDKLQKKYEDLYDSKLDVDTALVAAESTLDGLKLDYERLERDMSGNNNRQKELQNDFDQYKDKKEQEIKKMRTKTKKAAESYENVKFQLAKSNRINEKLQESLSQLKEENEKLSTELGEANEEIEVVNASMAELKDDYKEIKAKTSSYNLKLSEWQEKYKNLDLDFKQIESEKSDVTKAYDSYKSSTSTEIEKLSGHLTALQNQLEESKSYSDQYAAALSTSDQEKQELSIQLERQKKNAAKELADIQQHIHGLEADYQTIQEREELLDDRFSNLQDKHSDLEDAFKNTVDEKENLEIAYHEYKETTKERFNTLENEAKSWVEKLGSANLELAQNKEKAAELEKNKEKLIKELDKMRERYDQEMTMSGGEFEALNDTFDDLKSKYFDVNKELSSTKLEKERIYHEHQSFQEQILVEIQLVREENKKLSKNIASIKIEKRKLEYSNEELLERIDELEETSNLSSTKGQDRLIKMINRLRNNLEEQTEAINAFGKERKQYQQKIQNLEKKLGDASIKSVDASLNAGIADDLKRINGIGSMTEETLNDFGIYNFTQLATISEDNKALLSQVISSTPDKITNWAEAAQKLLEIK